MQRWSGQAWRLTRATYLGGSPKLEEAANSGGPTVRFLTAQTQAPQIGRMLAAAGGDHAEELVAQAAKTGASRQIYVANIPRALIILLEQNNMLRQTRTLMNGVVGEEWRFSPEASQYIVRFFNLR